MAEDSKDDEWKKANEGWDARKRAVGAIPPLPPRTSNSSLPDSMPIVGPADEAAKGIARAVQPLADAAAQLAREASLSPSYWVNRLEDQKDRRRDVAAAVDQNERSSEEPTVVSQEHGGGIQDAIESLIKKYLPEIVAFISLEAFAIPFFHAGAEAIVNGHLERGVYAYITGGASAVAGFTYHWWKKWPLWQRVRWVVTPFWPTPLLLLFVYIAGPEIYRRATTQVLSQLAVGFTQQQVDEKIAAATSALETQITALKGKLADTQNRQLQIGPQEALIISKYLGNPRVLPKEPHWAIFFTYPPENQKFYNTLIALMQDQLHPWTLDAPDSSTDLY